MLDARGRVVGMSTGLVLGSEVRLGRKSGIGFGVPADWIARALAWIRSGMPPRGWLGAHLVAADSERRERHRLPDHVKLFVAQVFPGSPAAAAGLRRGDGVVKVLGEEVGALPGLQLRLLSMKPGDAVTVEAVRPDGTVVMDLVLAPRPAKPRLDGIDALRYFGGLELVQKEGGRFVVASVFPGSMPALLKVAPGDVLLSVLSKKDWEHGARDNSRWRSVRNAADLEARLETAYSDLDFCLGLRFRARDGVRREVFLWTILTPTAAI
jgi:S1-C subfamily serine protease